MAPLLTLSHRVPSNGLTHHVLEWPSAAPAGTALLLHGFMDAAATWDLVAPSLAAAGPRVVVGHSMGGTVATLYAGSFPARVTRLVVCEGAGPPDGEHAHGPERMTRWIEETRSVRARGERTMASREEALRRLVVNHPRVPVDVLKTRLDALARDLPDGRVAWRADPLHATRSPQTFFAASLKRTASPPSPRWSAPSSRTRAT